LEFFEVLENCSYLYHDFCSEHQKVLTKFIHPNLLEIYSLLLLIYAAAVAVKGMCKYCSRVFGCDSLPHSSCIKTDCKILNLSVIPVKLK
jgi:hypothetical protein